MKIPPRFSLVEGLMLLVVLGTVFCLFPPLLEKERESAGVAKCRANLHALGAAIHLYASEHEGRLPDPNSPTPSALDGTYIGDGRMYGKLLTVEAGGFSDRSYLSTPHPLICPSLSPKVYALDPTYKRPDEIGEDNKILRTGYAWMYRPPAGTFRFASNDTIYRKPNEPLCFDFGWAHATGPFGRVFAQPSHAETMNVLHLGGYVTSVSLDEVNENANNWNSLYFFLRGGTPTPWN